LRLYRPEASVKIRVPAAAARLAVVLLVAAAFPLAAADVVGKIAYLDGTVEIVRDGETLSRSRVREGFEVQNFDVVKTGPDGEAEVQVNAATVPATTIRVASGTQFAIEIGKMGSKHQTNVGLMIGSLSVKCAKLTGSQSVKVQTDTAIMGVRGTSFTVTAPTSGDILVTCDEGEVECLDEDGTTALAKPGEVIEKLLGQRFLRLPMEVASLEQFKIKWKLERIAALKANALKAITHFAKLYNRLLFQLNKDFSELEASKIHAMIERWRSEDRSGTTGSDTSRVMEREELWGPLTRLRRTLVILERIYPRLVELKEYHDQGLGRGEIVYDEQHREATTVFFRRFERDRRDLERKMARVRLVTRLFAARYEGMVPWGASDED
jgi:hypothetical protein